MAIFSVASNASIDARSAANAAYISGLTAGEDLGALNVCRISTSDGKVYKAVTTSAQAITSGSVADYAGFTGKAVSNGQPVTLFRCGVMANLSTGLTTGKNLFISGSAGLLSDAIVLAGDSPVAMAISSTDIIVVK
jgi:hypothetical protein